MAGLEKQWCTENPPCISCYGSVVKMFKPNYTTDIQLILFPFLLSRPCISYLQIMLSSNLGMSLLCKLDI